SPRESALAAISLELPSSVASTFLEHGFVVVCMRLQSSTTADDLFARVARLEELDRLWRSGDVRSHREAWIRRGISMSRAEFDALAAAGATLLVSPSEEPRVLSDGADPLKVF